MNTELFRKIYTQIASEPESFDMGDWEREGDPECGTTRCVAGWAIAFELDIDRKGFIYSKDLSELGKRFEVNPSYFKVGAALLGLTHEEAYMLFYASEERAEQFVGLAARGEDDKARAFLVEEND